MVPKFEVIFLEEAINFVENLDEKTRKKIFYNIDKARLLNDPKLFEKIEDDIWYFRTMYSSMQYRVFAFWDKTDKNDTLVISTHGIEKKTQKTPKKEIEKAENLRVQYFKELKNQKK